MNTPGICPSINDRSTHTSTSPRPQCAMAPTISIGTACTRSVPTKRLGNIAGNRISRLAAIKVPEPTEVRPTSVPTNNPTTEAITNRPRENTNGASLWASAYRRMRILMIVMATAVSRTTPISRRRVASPSGDAASWVNSNVPIITPGTEPIVSHRTTA